MCWRFAMPGRIFRTTCSKMSFHASSDKGRRHDGAPALWCDPHALGTLPDNISGVPYGGTPVQGTEGAGRCQTMMTVTP